MSKPSPSFYSEWRVRSGIAPVLRDDADSPPETLLQAVWQHQRLLRDQLKSLEGQPVRILHPGFRSLEGGPDFRGAIVQFGDDAPQSGDIEVDLRASGWRAHGHDRNPAFKNVILHVVWEREGTVSNAPPRVPLRGLLDAPLGELSLWLGSDSALGLPEELRGRCCAPLRQLSPDQLSNLLEQAAQVRLQSKAAQFQARARQAGWEQSLWEGLFRALGYKHNVWAMQRLAELRPRWSNTEHATRNTPGSASSIIHHPPSAAVLQSRLFGISGLLPAELTRSQAGGDGYIRRVWDQWWRERDQFADALLPKTLWRFHALRPANHPQRRLALASLWCAAGDLPAKLEKWCATTPGSAGVPARKNSRAKTRGQDGPGRTGHHAPGAMPAALLEILQVGTDDFWSWHFTFRSARLKKPQPLLGATRVTDLAINVILPWLWSRAVEGKNRSLQAEIERRYLNWPPAEDNSLLRLARQRLLGGAGRKALPTAAAQQGLIQIVRDFCEHSNSLCDNCRLPDMVKEFARSSA